MKRETPTNSEVADLIERFIAHVRGYLTWDFAGDLSMSVLNPKKYTKKDLDSIEEAAHRVGDARNAILKDGPLLARAMEKIEEDSSGVLTIVHYAGGAGGPKAVRPDWRQIKIPLQRLAIRLRLPAQADAFGSSPGGPGIAGQGKAHVSCESASEKSSSASAQSAISPDETRAEVPAQVRTDGAQVRTLGRVRQWATETADEIKANAEGADFPALCLAAAYTAQAFECAQQAAHWTRGTKPPDVAEFLNTFAELRECQSRARELLEGQDKGKVWVHWPAAPGTVYCWKADNSALAVAYAFAQMIHIEILANSPISFNNLSIPCDSPALVQWRDNAIVGLGKHSLPPASDWPRWAMHRDRQALLCKLNAEYAEALKKAKASESSPPTDGAPMPETTEFLPCQIERLIADVDIWIRPRPGISVGSAADNYMAKKAEQAEISRNDAVQNGRSIAAELVKKGESARAIFTILNSLESKNYAQARKDWPAVKVELQETEIRFRLKDEAARKEQTAAGGVIGMEGADKATPKPKPPHRPPVCDPAKDAKIVAEWEASRATASKPTMEEFEEMRKLKPGELTKIIDRNRKRQKRDRAPE